MTNPIAGHTSATGFGTDSQGLRDGDGLSSPSLTNLYEGIHGNGILRLEATASGDSLRNSIVVGTAGYIENGVSQGQVKVYGGLCVLDGMLYDFAGGPGNSETFVIGTTGGGASHSGELPSVPANNSDVYVVVYLDSRSSPEAHIRYEVGTPKEIANGTPLIPNVFLSDPSGGTSLIHQTSILGVLRYTMTGGAGSVTASLSATPVIHDRRVYLRTSPMFLTPLTKGAVGNVVSGNAVNSAGALDARYSSPEGGDFSGTTVGALWQSHTPDAHSMLYYAAARELGGTPATHTHRLGPNEVTVKTLGAHESFTFDQSNIFVITNGTYNISPSGTFPPGHVVEITNTGSGTVTFTGVSTTLATNQYGKFVYDGSNWQKMFKQAVL